MNIHYCDFCGQALPMKYNLITLFREVALNLINQVPKVHMTYEICPDCYKLILKIFDLKKEKMSELCKSLEETYSLPVRSKKKTK